MEREEDKFWMISFIYGTYINEVRELSVLMRTNPCPLMSELKLSSRVRKKCMGN